MKYTLQGPKINLKVQEHFNIIISIIKKEIPNILSIMLAGSFGLGEGPVKLIKNKIYPFNDYDIYLITKRKIKSKKINKIDKEISNKLNFMSKLSFHKFTKKKKTFRNTFFVDLKTFSYNKLKNLSPRLRNYAMKKATKILYGKDFRYLIPNYSLSDIPLSDPAKLLLDRFNQLVEYYSLNRDSDPYILAYKIQAAYSACSTALLMLRRKFNCSYLKSAQILNKIYKKEFPELYKKLPNLHLKIKKYVYWKANPNKLPAKDLKQELFKAIYNTSEVTKYFFSKFLSKKISNKNDLSNALLKMSKEFYKPYIKYKLAFKSDLVYNILFPLIKLFLKYKYFLRVRKISKKFYFKIFFNKYTPDSYIYAAIPYLVLSIDYNNKINKSDINKLKEIIKKVYPLKGKIWEELSLIFRNAYTAFFFQDFE